MFIGNVILDEILDVIDLLNYLEDMGYALVRKGATELWSLAEPIKKPIRDLGKSAKNQALKGWRVIAPVVKPAASNIKDGTVAGWRYIKPKANDVKNAAVSGWQYVQPRVIPALNTTKNAACTVINGVKNCTVKTYEYVKPKIETTSKVVKNGTVSGWNLIKPLPGHAANFSVSAWNFVAPTMGGIIGGAMNQVGKLWNATSNLVSNAIFGGAFDFDGVDVFGGPVDTHVIDFENDDDWENELVRVIN